MKESEYSRKIVSYLEEQGALVNVNTANIYDKAGRADVEACYNGFYLAFELKTGSYEPTGLQLSYLQKVRDVGGYADVLRDEDGFDYLEMLLDTLDQYDYSKQRPLPKIKEDVGQIVFD